MVCLKLLNQCVPGLAPPSVGEPPSATSAAGSVRAGVVGGRFRALLPEAEGASACVCARATSQREAGGRRRAETLKGPAFRRGVTIRDGDGSHLVLEVVRCVLSSAV